MKKKKKRLAQTIRSAAWELIPLTALSTSKVEPN